MRIRRYGMTSEFLTFVLKDLVYEEK